MFFKKCFFISKETHRGTQKEFLLVDSFLKHPQLSVCQSKSESQADKEPNYLSCHHHLTRPTLAGSRTRELEQALSQALQWDMSVLTSLLQGSQMPTSKNTVCYIIFF